MRKYLPICHVLHEDVVQLSLTSKVKDVYFFSLKDHSSFCGLSSLVSYFKFVPLEEEILDFFTPVARHILTLLQGKPCIPVKRSSNETEQPYGGDNGKSCDLVLPCQAIVCEDSVIQELIPSILLEEHLGLSYLHPEMVPVLHPTLRSRLGIETLSLEHLIEIGKAEVKKASAVTPHSNDRKPGIGRITWVARWLQCMYRCLEQERNSSQEMLDLIGSLNVIPLTDGSFANVKEDSIFLPLSRKKTSEGAVPKKNKGGSYIPFVVKEEVCILYAWYHSSVTWSFLINISSYLKLLGI